MIFNTISLFAAESPEDDDDSHRTVQVDTLKDVWLDLPADEGKSPSLIQTKFNSATRGRYRTLKHIHVT